MAYKPTVWVDNETPVNAENLNKLESGVAAAVVSVNGVSPDKNGNVDVAGGGGLSTTAANLLIEILQSAVYNANVSGKIASLKEALTSGGSGGDSGTETPDEPDVPTVTDDITVSDGVMTIISVGSEITVSGGVMSIA